MRKHTKNTIKLVDLTYIADDAFRTFFKKGVGSTLHKYAWNAVKEMEKLSITFGICAIYWQIYMECFESQSENTKRWSKEAIKPAGHCGNASCIKTHLENNTKEHFLYCFHNRTTSAFTFWLFKSQHCSNNTALLPFGNNAPKLAKAVLNL